ncbi:MAG: hypothetical protein PUG67_05755 [Peptoniphilaceae bacterium]|nr:hypothetical protein [Peptoniphilaceae bacterium]MDY6018986.1 hypothetical protein [Anaerococcus sp.]
MANTKISEAQLRAKHKWREKNKNRYKRYEVTVNIEKDPDIYEYLEKKENKSGYLLDLIKKDIENS